MKKVLCIFLVFVIVISGITPGYASGQISQKEDYIEDMLEAAKSIFEVAPRQEGKEETGLAGDGSTIYTTYPQIKKDVRDKLITKRLDEIRTILQKYELEVLKEGFEAFKRVIKEQARFFWLPEGGKPQYAELDIYLPSLEDVFSFAEYSVEENKLKDVADKEDQAYQDEWEPGMPSVRAYRKVDEAIKLNYVPQNIQNNYQAPITREEFAELYVTAIFEAVNRENNEVSQRIKNRWDFATLTVDNFLSKVTSTEYFTDTKNKYVSVANMLGIVNPTSTHKYNPTGRLTREQMAEMIINYTQTLEYNLNEVEFSDLNSSSNKDAIKRAYLAGIIDAKKSPVVKNDKLIEKGLFDGKAAVSREEAIITIMKMNKYTGARLNMMLLRGYLYIDMEELMSGFDIDGNTINMRRSGRDSKAYAMEKYLFICTEMDSDGLNGMKKTSYILKYPSEAINSIFMGQNWNEDMFKTSEMDKVLSGKETLYDYKIFKIEHNKNGYLVTITKSNNYKYFCGRYDFIDNGKLVDITCINSKKESPINTYIAVKSSFKTEKLRNMEKNTYSCESVYPLQWKKKVKIGDITYGPLKEIGTQVGYAIELEKEVYLNGKQIKAYSIGGETAFMLDELKDFGYSYKLLQKQKEIELRIPDVQTIKKYSDTSSKKLKCIEGNSIYTLIGDNYELVAKDQKNNKVGTIRCFKAKSGERFIIINDLWMTNDNFHNDKYGFPQNGYYQHHLEGSSSPYFGYWDSDLAVVENINDKLVKITLLSRSESYQYYRRYGSEHYLVSAFPQLGKIVFSPPNYEAWITAKEIVKKIITDNMTDAEKVTAIQEAMYNYGSYMPGSLWRDKSYGNYHGAYQALVEKNANYYGWFRAYRMLLVQAELETFPENEDESGKKELKSGGLQTSLIAVKIDGKWEYINFLPKEYEF